MTPPEPNLPLLVLFVGTTIVLTILVKAGFNRIGVPSLVGFIVLGFLLTIGDSEWHFLSDGGRAVFEFLADIGIITLLFRVGLESNIVKLVHQLRHASFIWFGDVFVSGILGFLIPYYLLGVPLIPSLFVASAFTATSVGVSVAVWLEAQAINTTAGETLLDVAELDDISGIFLMALLFSVVPALRAGAEIALLPTLSRTAGVILLKLAGFCVLCVVFSKYVERHITELFQSIDATRNTMLMVSAIGFIMAALAGLLGISVAVGAFFAGLVFSRDPDAVKIDAAFAPLYELFTPFFFVGIGLSINPHTLWRGIGLGLLLLIVAAAGKFIGAGGTAWVTLGRTRGVLLGASMIPRAEIALVIMQKGLSLGEWAVPSHVFSGVVVVSAITAIVSPLLVRSLLHKWPQTE